MSQVSQCLQVSCDRCPVQHVGNEIPAGHVLAPASVRASEIGSAIPPARCCSATGHETSVWIPPSAEPVPDEHIDTVLHTRFNNVVLLVRYCTADREWNCLQVLARQLRGRFRQCT